MAPTCVIALCGFTALAAAANTAPPPKSPASHDPLRAGRPHLVFMGAEPTGDDHHVNCVPPELQAAMQQLIAKREAQNPLPPLRDTPPKWKFIPMGGTHTRDILPGNFVDLNPASGPYIDFNCNPFTYDGHAGTDIGIRSFDEQIIGIPVFAAADGVVAFTQDGFPDMNTQPGADSGNYVMIDHGAGRYAWYFHLKTGSVAVSPGQPVVAGQQIGKVGSSGQSFGPHLHFQTMDGGNTVVTEPWAGPCRAGPSQWDPQPVIDDACIALDAGTTYDDLFQVPGRPWAPPLSAEMIVSDQYVTLWFHLSTLPTGSNFKEKIYRNDGVMVLNAGPYNFDNDAPYRDPWYFVYWFTPALDGWDAQHLGAWRYVLEINGQQVVDAPFQLRSARTAGFNRAPAPVTIAFDPPAPRVGTVPFCRVNVDRVNDDPDFDVVRYTFNWTVNGAPVRQVTNGCYSDALPRTALHVGDVLKCTVTPSDGLLSAPAVSRSVLILNPCTPDFDGNGSIEPADIAAFVNAWLAALTGGTLGGDFDNSGSVEPADIAAFVNAWLAALSNPC